MAKKKRPDQHGIFVHDGSDVILPRCTTGDCMAKSKFILVERYEKKSGKGIEKRRGLCYDHALKYAQDDECPSCTKRVLENKPAQAVTP